VRPLRVLLVCAAALACRAAVTITIDDSATPRTFDPRHALGAGVDGHEKGDTRRMFTPAAMRLMRSAGYSSLTYRLRTELGGEVWHWNPAGRWSDAAHRRGYWVSSAVSRKPIVVSYGYRLPRRGNTHDQANDDGYSRIDDGDESTFWKSNPYVDAHFTHEPAEAHPQYMVIETAGTPVNDLRISWGVPFAVEYAVQYTNNAAGPEDFADDSVWTAFPSGTVSAAAGGMTELKLAPDGIAAQYVRIRLLRSSLSAPAGSRDVRDSLGYAVREVHLGTIDATGAFTDIIRHGRDKDAQTNIWVSSTDPWHTAADRDPRVEQPGFDLIFRGGLADGQPAMVPVGVLYDTPENAVAELRFLKSRAYRIGRMEMGEEPDEQYGPPEDYGSLFLQWADALHAVDPAASLGGPSVVADSNTPDPDSHTPAFVGGLMKYLAARGRTSDFRFFSFEWYPFDDICEPVAPQLAAASDLLSGTVDRFHAEGVPPAMPMAITEYGYSAYGTEAEVTLPGALLDADTVGRFLTAGGDQTFLYGWEPAELNNDRPCTWGNNVMFLLDGHRPTATFHESRLLTTQWLEGDGAHRLYTAHSDARDADNNELVRAYPVRRPDGRWSVLILNVDPDHAQDARLLLHDGTPLSAAEVWQFSEAQYKWHADKADGYPELTRPAERVAPGAGGTISLPPWSLTVVLGQ
jgi:hypothetical protein